MTLSWTHTKAAAKPQHPFLFFSGALSDNSGQMKVETWNNDFQYILSLSPGEKLHHYVIFVMCSSTGWKPHLSSLGPIENQSLGNSAGLSAFSAVKENSWRKAAGASGQWELLGPDAMLAVEVDCKVFSSSAFQSNLLELFIEFPCRQDVNMPLKSANTIMKTDICNCICVAPLTQS